MPAFRNQRAIEELDQLLAAGVEEGELGRLVTLARTVHDSAVVHTPDPAFRARLRAELLQLQPVAHATLADRLRDASQRVSTSTVRALRAATASAVAATMVGTAGVAAAAESAIPGDTLYSVKELVEATRLLLADSGAPDGRLHLAFARERLEELEAGSGRLTDDQIVDLLHRMDASSIAGAEELLTAATTATTSELLSLVADFTDEQTRRLEAVARDLPAFAAPFLADSFENLRRIDLQVEALANPECVCTDTVALTQLVSSVIDAVDTSAVEIPAIVIVPAGQGPAVPTPPCACDTPPATPPREELPPVTPPEPTPDPVEPDPDPVDEDPQPDPEPDPEPDPVDEDDLLPLPDDLLPDPVQDAVEDVEDLVEEVLPDEVQEPVQDATEPIADLVDEILDEVPLP